MTDRPAAEFGSYVDAKFMRGLKVMRVMVDIPIERSNEFLKVFGAPNGVDPVPVVLARLEPSAIVGETSGISRAPYGAQEDTPKPKKEFTRSQIAALKIRDAAFCTWLRSGSGQPDELTDDEVLKRVLHIESKRELDTDSLAAERFNALLASYDYRDRVK